MSELALPQLPKEEYPSYPVNTPAAPSQEQEAEHIWQKNKAILEGFKRDILTSEPRSKEFRFAIRVAKHFFQTDNTYDARGVSEALQFLDVIRKRHQGVVDTSSERQLLRSVRKVLSAIFRHHYKFNDPHDLERIIMAYNTLNPRYTALQEENPNPPFTPQLPTEPSMAIDSALTNSTEPQMPVIRPLHHPSESPVRHSDQSSPTPLRSTDPATLLSLFDQSSTPNGLALSFQAEHQLTTNEGAVEEPPPAPARAPNRVASLLMRARALKNSALIEPPALDSYDPFIVPTQMEGLPEPEDIEMHAGEPQVDDDVVFQWTIAHEPGSSPPKAKEAVVEDTPMETLAPEVTQDEVPDVEAPQLEGDDNTPESSLTNVSTPSLLPFDQPATEPELPEATYTEPPPLSEELSEELQEAVRPLVPYFQAKSDNGAVNTQATDESLAARYGPELLRVAKDALDEIRSKYVIEEVKRSLNVSPTQEEDLFSEPDDVEPVAVQEPPHPSPSPLQLDAEPESAVEKGELTEPSNGVEEPERVASSNAVEEAELADPPSTVEEPELAEPTSTVEELELADPPSAMEELELTDPPRALEEPELTIHMESEPAQTTYSEQCVQTSSIAAQASPTKEQIQLYETQESGIASFTVRNDCCRTSFSFEITPEFYEELRNDRTAKILANCSLERGHLGDNPIDDSWILMRINWKGNPDSEFLVVPNKSRNAPTTVQQVIPLSAMEHANRLELRRSWCAGGLRGLRVDIKVSRAIRQQRKRGRDAFDGESQDDVDSETLGPFVDTFKRARI